MLLVNPDMYFHLQATVVVYVWAGDAKNKLLVVILHHYKTIPFQNLNFVIRLSEVFMIMWIYRIYYGSHSNPRSKH